MKIPTVALVSLACALAACGGSDREDPFEQEGSEDHQFAAPSEEGDAASMTFGPDLASLELGPRIEGSEFKTTFVGGEGDTGLAQGYVACGAGVASCDEADEEAVYTYVIEVTPNARSSVFRTALPAYGFTGTAGYDKSQARAAIAGDSQLVMRCVNGALVWAINGGEGWSGKPVSVYWQSDSPPADSQPAYQLISQGRRAEATAPFPAEGSTDKCT